MNLETSVKHYEVDGFTGATAGDFHFGAHALFPVGKNRLETGVDIMYNDQSFTYRDKLRGFNGIREIHMTQLMLPLTFMSDCSDSRLTKGYSA